MLSKEDIDSARGTYEKMAKDLFNELMEEFLDSMGEESDEYVISCEIKSEVHYACN